MVSVVNKQAPMTEFTVQSPKVVMKGQLDQEF